MAGRSGQVLEPPSSGTFFSTTLCLIAFQTEGPFQRALANTGGEDLSSLSLAASGALYPAWFTSKHWLKSHTSLS
jgi:hypothetical protein